MIITNKYQLKRHIHYNQFTGEFTRIQQHQAGRNYIGKIDTKNLADGKIKILNCWYQASHLAFLYMTGSFPEHRVIHVDGDKTNYTWDNLAPEEKTYHGKGSITWVEKRQHYQAVIGDKYIGVFKTKEEAAAALDSAHLSADMTREQAAKRLKEAGITGIEAKHIFDALNQVCGSK